MSAIPASPPRHSVRAAGARVSMTEAVTPRTDPSRASVSVVIPARNEARNVAWVLRRLPDFVDEVVLVDGRSTDDTVAVARAVRPDIVVVEEDGRGKGCALRTGFRTATGDFVVMIDADGSMDPGEIERYVDALAGGHEFVKGSRFMQGGGSSDMTWFRRAGNFGLLVLANLLYGTRHTDLCYGYLGFRRRSLAVLDLDAPGFEIETQIVARAARAGLRTAEVPSFEAERMFGESNLNTIRDGFRVLRTILRERIWRRRPALGVMRFEDVALRHARRIDEERAAAD